MSMTRLDELTISEDFADRVAEDWCRSRARARQRRAAVWAGLAVILTFAIGLSWWRSEASNDHGGELIAQERSTVHIGDRAVAVAERGSSLSWSRSRDDDGWLVRQELGSIFYRVDTGDRFIVETPEGTISVTGTCFVVEVHSMKPANRKLLAAAGLVSSLTAATVVTLYEGRVVVASTDGTEIELQPGESGALAAGQRPVVVEGQQNPPPLAAVVGQTEHEAVLRNQLRMRRAEIEELESEVDRLETELGPQGPEIGSDEWIQACATSTDGREVEGCSYLDPGQEVLEEMARCGAVRIDTPPALYEGGLSQMMEGLELEDQEAEVFERIATDFTDEYREQLASLAEEHGIDPGIVDQVPWFGLMQMLNQELADDTWFPIQQQIARERAGQDPRPPKEWSLLERALRLQTTPGDMLEDRVAEELGRERARELRAQRDGWGAQGFNTRYTLPGRCPESPSDD